MSDLSCDKCGVTFISTRNLRDHERSRVSRGGICPTPRRGANENGRYSCAIEACGQDFDTADKRNKHERKYHRATNDNEVATSMHTFNCHICGAYLGNEESLRRHMNSHRNPDFYGKSKRTYGQNSDGGLNLLCRFCPLTFNHLVDLTDHEYIFHRPVEMMRQLTDRFLKHKNPLLPAHGFTPRALPPSNLAKAAEEENWMFKWVTGYMNFKIELLDRNPYSVYLVGVLGLKYKVGQDIRSFIKKNPNQLSLYIGRTVCQSLVNYHHFEILTPLSEAACRGQTIILLNSTNFHGDWRRKTEKIRRLEARMIEVALTDKEFEPVPGLPQYNILNSRRETSNLANLDDETIAEIIEKGVTGVKWICLEETCDDCDAIRHPRWDEDLVIDMSKAMHLKEKMEQVELPGRGHSSREKLTRPISQAAVHEEVEVRVQEFKQRIRSSTYYTYTVIVTDNDQFDPSQTAEEICRQILERKEEEDLQIPVYFGVKSTDEASAHHEEGLTSLGKLLKQGGKTAIQISTSSFATRDLARRDEALRILHASLSMRFATPGVETGTPGIKFDILNQRMEWVSLSLCSEQEIRFCIHLAWLGVPPVYLGVVGMGEGMNMQWNGIELDDVEMDEAMLEEALQEAMEGMMGTEVSEFPLLPVMKFQHQGYPVDVKAQVLAEKVIKVFV